MFNMKKASLEKKNARRIADGKFITSLYLDKETIIALDKIAKTENRKRAQLMRILIVEGIKERLQTVSF